MKVLLLNGSPNEHGCTFTALAEVAKTLNGCGVETETLWLGKGPQRDCGGFVFGTPVYYAHPSGRVLSVLDRVFFAGGRNFAHKPGAAVCSARRGGTTASFDAMNKYFTISQMPVVGSTYWNMVHGNSPEEVLQDKEGLDRKSVV